MNKKIVRLGLLMMGSMVLLPGNVTAFAQDGPGNPEPLNAQTISCPMSLPEGDIDGETMVCGQIEVPENWDDPSGRTVLITYAIAKAHNAAPFSDPIIYFEGGPGISALEEIEWLDGNTDHLRMTRDIIFFDQRGIRYSSNLECPLDIKNQAIDFDIPEDIDPEVLAVMENPNVTVDSDLDVLFAAANLLGPGRDVVSCTPYFKAQGIDLSQYGTDNNALDAIALMNALDYSTYNLYGISYGSNHAMEVMRYYDENDSAELPPIRSVVIDGVIGVWVDFVFNNAISIPVVILDVFEACEADDACSASYPNIRQRAIDLLEAVEATPLVIDDSTPITVTDLRAVLRRHGLNPEGLVYLPRLIDELERGETDLYSRLQAGTLPVVSESTLPDVSNPFDPGALAGNEPSTQMRILADEVESLYGRLQDEAPLAVSESAPADVSNPFDPISLEASELSADIQIVADEVEFLAAQSRRLSAAYERGISLPQFFADELADSAEQLPSAAQAPIALFLQSVPISAPDRDQLLQAISSLPQIEQTLLVSLIGLMDDDDIAEVYEILADPLYSERFLGIFQIIQQVIHCNDRVFDLNNTFENLRASDAPQLIPVNAIDWNVATRCEGYGLSGSPTEPIVNSSGFPVFIANGALDTSTTVLWGEQVYENLENARMVTFPNLGHGATRKTACSRDITNAFFMYPEAELNLACIEALHPVFVLPEDELPS